MQWIILIGEDKLNLNAVKAIKHYENMATETNENRYYVDYGKDHIFYDDQGNTFEDYEQEELNKIPFANPHFIMMIYTSEERMKKVIQQDNFLRGIYVDNGFGLIVPIEEFIKLGMPMDTR